MSLPFELNDVPEEINKELMSLYSGQREGFLHVGPNKYLLHSEYRRQAAGYYNMKLRPDDVWIVTYPRSGTTWTQELVWLINNDLDYDRALSEKLTDRFLFLEASIINDSHFKKRVIEMNKMDEKQAEEYLFKCQPGYEKADVMESPRHIKSHLPFSLLPPRLLDTCKVIYVARNPKDVAVSFYYLSRLLEEFGFEGDFEKYWDLFQKDMIPWTPFWSHVEEAWKLKSHPNVLFLFYEHMKKDLKGTILKVADFFNKSLSNEQMSKLEDHLSIENFRKSPALQQLPYGQAGILRDGEPGFFRKGQVGGWRSEFSQHLNSIADAWIKENMKDTDLKFDL